MRTSAFVSSALAVFVTFSAPELSAAPFFDPEVPVHATPVDTGDTGAIARGLLVRDGGDGWVIFDQDLLRPARWIAPTGGKPPVSPVMMAQASWEDPTRKGGVHLPKPPVPGLALVPAFPGVGKATADLLKDPRPIFGSDAGRGGLHASGRTFTGHVLAGRTGVLAYDVAGTGVREWYETRSGNLLRHLAVEPGAELSFLAAGGEFTVKGMVAGSKEVAVASNHPGLALAAEGDLLVARLAASSSPRRVTLSYGKDRTSSAGKTPPPPAAVVPGQWARAIETAVIPATRRGPGWLLDTVELPEANPWKRRVRPADIVFTSPDAAAVVTFEGDVWRLDLRGDRVRWLRSAAGLSEPLSIEAAGGAVQVHTRNGLVRLHDRDGDGVTDDYENHSSLLFQTSGTRGYALDMEMDADGTTWCSFGGIGTDGRSIHNRAPANPHAGAIVKISPDGSTAEVVARSAREPFFARDPETGRIAMSDQQGNWVPSSGIFPVPQGADFGYGRADASPQAPAVWIPHDQDTSSSSPLWLRGSAFPFWEGGLLHLSYGTGRLFLVRPGGAWPAREGALLPLGIETGLPVLHARVNPGDGSIWLAGFRVYDSRAPELQGLARLRPDPKSAVPDRACDARVVREGVVLDFAAPLDPASVRPEAVVAKQWNYRRGSGYGSPRLDRQGRQGTDAVPTGSTSLSRDGRRVFIHIPALEPVMQLEITHRFHPIGAQAESQTVFFTVAHPPAADWASLGFDPPALEAGVAKVHERGAEDTLPTIERGRELSVRYGCTACHAVDDAIAGHSGPAWNGLFGSERRFTKGAPRVADDAYLVESILDPGKEIVEGFTLGMGSYAGVLNDGEIRSIILYIRSLK